MENWTTLVSGRNLDSEEVQREIEESEQSRGLLTKMVHEPTGVEVGYFYQPNAAKPYIVESLDDRASFPQEGRYATREEGYVNGHRVLRRLHTTREEVLNEEIGDTDAVEDSSTANSQSTRSSAAFRLEQNLERYLFESLSSIEPGLTPYEEDSRQFSTETGRIDILAADQAGTPTVIELKVGDAKHDALGQVLSYMVDIQNQFAAEEVRGLIISETFSRKLRNAVSQQQNVELCRYDVEFTVEPVANQ